MVALAGSLVPTEPYTNAPICKAALGDWKFFEVPLGPTYWYRMRAWDTDDLVWEVWTSSGAPNPNPPSGHTVTGVTIIGIWEV